MPFVNGSLVEETGVDNTEPVWVRAGASAAAHALLAFLVLHGVISDTASSALTQFVVTALAALISLLVGYLIRRKVFSPATVAKLLSSGDRGGPPPPVG